MPPASEQASMPADDLKRREDWKRVLSRRTMRRDRYVEELVPKQFSHELLFRPLFTEQFQVIREKPVLLTTPEGVQYYLAAIVTNV